MFINEVVKNFVALKQFERKNGCKTFEKEKMIDEVFAGHLPEYEALPNWMMKKLEVTK